MEIDKYKGLITRKRVTVHSIEESVIDFVITTEDLVESIESILIDEDRKHALTKFVRTKKSSRRVESDHNPIVTKLDLTWNKSSQKKRLEMFNLKNGEGQLKFKEVTSNTNFLSSVFDNDKDINVTTKTFLKRLNGCLHKSFKKIRITDKTNKEIKELFQRRKFLRNQNDDHSKEALKQVEDELSMKCAKVNKQIIEKELAGLECEEG